MPSAGAGRQRLVGSLAAMLGFACFGLGLNGWIESRGAERVGTAFDVLQPVRERLAAPVTRAPGAFRAMLLADSTMTHRRPREEGVPLLRAALRRARAEEGPVDVVSVVFPGFDVYDYWALADLIVDARPDQIVLALNLRNFDIRSPGNRRRAELVGWISPRRIPQAFVLPLREIGMSPDRVLLYVGLVQARLDGIWADLRERQARFGASWKSWVDSPTGEASTPLTRFREAALEARFGETLSGLSRYSRADTEAFYGTSLAGLPGDPPVLEVLRAALARFERAGIPTLVYVAPVNGEYIRSLGFATDGLERTTQRIGALVREEGASFADFHALLPDRSFKDPVHFSKDGRENGIRVLARELARAVLEVDRRNAGRPRD